MFRKFFAAVILAVFMLNVQIVAAEDYDWSKAPRIGTKAQLARYIENGRRKGQTVFRVILMNGFKVDNRDDFWNLAVCRTLNGNWTNYSDGTTRIIYEITEYPGTRVANAYLSREPHMAWKNLIAEEQKLYNIAVGIVDEVKKRSSEIEKARYIHDVICDRVLEYKVENERNETAIGALIDGYAQCQGYSDAFYMLGRMAGLNVSRIRGHINKDNGLHIWNTITFSDGKTYFVDLTNDDLHKTDVFFCATKETMQKYFSCEWEIIPNLL